MGPLRWWLRTPNIHDDDLAVTDTMIPVVGKDEGTYRTSSE
jgi:hypothetical protein